MFQNTTVDQPYSPRGKHDNSSVPPPYHPTPPYYSPLKAPAPRLPSNSQQNLLAIIGTPTKSQTPVRSQEAPSGYGQAMDSPRSNSLLNSPRFAHSTGVLAMESPNSKGSPQVHKQDPMENRMRSQTFPSQSPSLHRSFGNLGPLTDGDSGHEPSTPHQVYTVEQRYQSPGGATPHSTSQQPPDTPMSLSQYEKDVAVFKQMEPHSQVSSSTDSGYGHHIYERLPGGSNCSPSSPYILSEHRSTPSSRPSPSQDSALCSRESTPGRRLDSDFTAPSPSRLSGEFKENNPNSTGVVSEVSHK